MQAIQRVSRFISGRILTSNWNQQLWTLETASQPQYNQAQVRSMSSETPTYTADYLSEKLRRMLEAEHIDIEDLSNCGCGMKFDAVIVSPQFEGKPILNRQRLVNQILAEEMKHIHAFTMRTLTPTQWKESMSKKQ